MTPTALLLPSLIAAAVFVAVLGIDRLRNEQRMARGLRRVWPGDKAPENAHARVSGWRRAIGLLAQISPAPRRGSTADDVARAIETLGLEPGVASPAYRAAVTASTLLLCALSLTALQALAAPVRWEHALIGLAAATLLAIRLCSGLLQRAARDHWRQVAQGLPELADLLIICIDGGHGLDLALQRAAREMRRHNLPLARELERLNRSVRAGAQRSEALRALAERSGLEELREMATMLIQAERSGVALLDSLRNHAAMMRVRRLQRAEESAAKLPVKVMAPLVLCLLPALMIVLFGPAVLQIGSAMRGG